MKIGLPTYAGTWAIKPDVHYLKTWWTEIFGCTTAVWKSEHAALAPELLHGHAALLDSVGLSFDTKQAHPEISGGKEKSLNDCLGLGKVVGRCSTDWDNDPISCELYWPPSCSSISFLNFFSIKVNSLLFALKLPYFTGPLCYDSHACLKRDRRFPD